MMSHIHTPSNWVILKIEYAGNIIYKILGEWSGGYSTGESWQLNSGIVGMDENDNYYSFHGFSGSTYECRKNKYGIHGAYVQGVLSNLIQRAEEQGGQITVVDEDVDFSAIKWEDG